jgi:type I restriction enzyme S subunit
MTFSNIDFVEPTMVPASSICEAIFDGTHDSPKQQEFGFKLVTSRHIKANGVLLEDAYFINENDYIKINKRSRLQIGDVLFTMIGTVGEVCRISTEPDFAIKNIGVFRPTVASDSVWIYYYLRSPEGRKNIEAAKRGTTQQFMGLKELREFPINFPKDSLYRRNQMQILELLDAKIDANESLSKTLESIAQTIFKSWFIDFDPVKAKMAGETPAGMDAATEALFPDSMEESELGLMPKGWNIKIVSDFGKVVTGKTPSTKVTEYWGDQVPFVTIPDMHGQILVTSTARALSKQGADSQRSQNVPAGSTMVTCIATPGLVGYATKDCQTNQQINSVIPSMEYSSEWLFWHLRGLIPILIRNSGIGTVFANLNKSDFSKIKSITPPIELRNSFSEFVKPIMELLETLNHESQFLRDIRDGLLPRLISGELQIPEEMLAS